MFCDIMPDSLKRIAVILEGRVQYERKVREWNLRSGF